MGRHCQTDDNVERSVTAAFHDMFTSIDKSGATEDPLVLIGRSLVRCIGDIQFVFYCYQDDDVGAFASVREGVKLLLPPPNVQRKIVMDLRRATAGGKVAVIDQNMALANLPPVLRRKLRPRLCVAAEIVCEGRSAAVLALFLPADFKVTDRHRTWMRLFADAASAHLTRFRSNAHVRDECNEMEAARQKLSLCVESMRAGVRKHLSEVAKLKCDLHSGEKSLREVQHLIDASVASLQSVVDMEVDNDCVPGFMNLDANLCAWMNEGMHDPRIKAIVGIRGSFKSEILHAVRNHVLASGVDDSRVVIVDFEDARFRRFKTADDLLNYLAAFPKSNKVNYLFIDEVGMVDWHDELLRRLQTMPNWNVWVTTSTMHTVSSFVTAKGMSDLVVHRTWADPDVPRSQGELERIWCQIFMRDVVSGFTHLDIRALEALSEYYSDHLGESPSLREISKALGAAKCQLSTVSIGAYRQALVDTHLLEISPIYDTFEGKVVTSASGRVFYTDLELRKWRFGSAPQDEATRLALNQLYLELRSKHKVVYTPRSNEADFVTLQANGKPVMWKLPPDPLQFPEKFRGGGGGVIVK